MSRRTAWGVFLLCVVLGGTALLAIRGASRARPTVHALGTQVQPIDPQAIVFDTHLRRDVVRDQLVVTLARGASEEDFLEQVQRVRYEGVRVIGRIPALGMLQVTVPARRRHALRAELDRLRAVRSADHNDVWRALRTFDDPALADGSTKGWGLAAIGMQGAWARTAGGARVGVIDSGARLDHEELSDRIISPWSMHTRSPVMQLGEFAPGAWIADHGTHCAITTLGRAGNGRGTAGVSPSSTCVPVQVLYLHEPDSQEPRGATTDIVAGMRHAIDAGAVVLNMSLGSDVPAAEHLRYQNGSEAERRAIDEQRIATARDAARVYSAIVSYAAERDVIIVKAAGNDGLPARWDGLCLSGRVLGVAAVDQGLQRSDYGIAPDGRAMGSRHGEGTTLSAPGTDIWSGLSNPSSPYGFKSGTSMAAPHVAGVVALLKTVKPSLTFEEAREILVATGRPLTTDEPLGPLVQADAALEELERRMAAGIPPPPREPPLPPGPPLPAPTIEPAPQPPSPAPPVLRPSPPNPVPSPAPLPAPDAPQPPERSPEQDPPIDWPEIEDPDAELPGPVEPIVELPAPALDPEIDRPGGPPADNVPKDPPSYQDVLAGPAPWLDARVRARIDEWLSRATPSAGGRFNEYGVVVDIPGLIVRTDQKPDWAATKYEYLWHNSRKWRSRDLGTLYEFLHDLERTGGRAPPHPNPAPGTAPSRPDPDRHPPEASPTRPPAGRGPDGAVDHLQLPPALGSLTFAASGTRWGRVGSAGEVLVTLPPEPAPKLGVFQTVTPYDEVGSPSFGANHIIAMWRTPELPRREPGDGPKFYEYPRASDGVIVNDVQGLRQVLVYSSTHDAWVAVGVRPGIVRLSEAEAVRVARTVLSQLERLAAPRPDAEGQRPPPSLAETPRHLSLPLVIGRHRHYRSQHLPRDPSRRGSYLLTVDPRQWVLSNPPLYGWIERYAEMGLDPSTHNLAHVEVRWRAPSQPALPPQLPSDMKRLLSTVGYRQDSWGASSIFRLGSRTHEAWVAITTDAQRVGLDPTEARRILKRVLGQIEPFAAPRGSGR